MTQSANFHSDILIVGAGAAGLMAAIQAARKNKNRSVTILEGARRIGAKILIAGGGRCNVTHDVVDETAFAGSTRPAIRKVLRRFDAAAAIQFFRELGVVLKVEEGGKMFPVTDRAQTVLDALLRAAASSGVKTHYPCRVESLEKSGELFVATGTWGSATASKVILATGGRSVPKTGSDGHGYTMVRQLGHSLTPRIFPGLVPLLLPQKFPLTPLSGLSAPARLEVRSGTGRRIAAFTGSLLCTHFGISGPVTLDISRYLLDAQAEDKGAMLFASWLPESTSEQLDAELREARDGTLLSRLRARLPERLLRTLCQSAGVAESQACGTLRREQRESVVRQITNMMLPVTRSRGFDYAEVTAGGVPLREVRLETMESRVCPGLYLCGEICDVDGRIGGYNFQWAWASGFIAGISI